MDFDPVDPHDVGRRLAAVLPPSRRSRRGHVRCAGTGSSSAIAGRSKLNAMMTASAVEPMSVRVTGVPFECDDHLDSPFDLLFRASSLSMFKNVAP